MDFELERGCVCERAAPLGHGSGYQTQPSAARSAPRAEHTSRRPRTAAERFVAIFNRVYLYVSVCGHTHVGAGDPEVKKTTLDPSELELQDIISRWTGVLEPNGSSARAYS